eukprot:5576-Heterococcus_DN1.PRE.1
MQAYRPKRTYELLLRKAERALETATDATAREQLQHRVDRIKALATEANTTLLWMSRFASKKHVPKLDTLKAKQALLARLRAELPAHAAEAEAYKGKEKVAAKAAKAAAKVQAAANAAAAAAAPAATSGRTTP